MKLLSSQISLDNVRLYAYHGVMEQERRVGAWYSLTITADCLVEEALESDDVSDTINYASMLEIAKREMAVPSNLLEHVAGRIACAVMETWPKVTSLTIELGKDNPPMSANCDRARVRLCFSND